MKDVKGMKNMKAGRLHELHLLQFVVVRSLAGSFGLPDRRR
jgi:hypothetical protein